MKTVLVAGELNVDLVLGGCAAMPQADTEILAETFHQTAGSSSMICAIGLARLGRGVRFCGRVGDDAHGEFCLAALRAAGIDVTAVGRDPAFATGVTVSLSTPTDRALVTCPGSITALRAEDVTAAALAGVGHLHVSSYYLQSRLRPGLPGLLARAHAAGLTTSLDPGFDPARRWGDDAQWRALLDEVDVFLPSRSEALAISRAADVRSALAALDNGHTRVVVKCGAEGALARAADGTVVQVPAYAPGKVRDTTGAGDSFNAGFLHAWLDGLPLGQCLRSGNACGSLSTRGVGGTASQADAATLATWLAAHPPETPA